MVLPELVVDLGVGEDVPARDAVLEAALAPRVAVLVHVSEQQQKGIMVCLHAST